MTDGLKSHVISIAYSASFYFWSCSCGRSGPNQIVARRARNGGQRHVRAMEASR